MKRLFSWFYHFIMWNCTGEYKNNSCESFTEVEHGYIFCSRAKNHFGKHKAENRNGKRKWV